MPAIAGYVALINLLPDENAPVPHIFAERFGQVQKRTGYPPFHREEARGCKRIVGIAQTPRQHLHHVAVDFRAGFPNCVEIRLAYKNTIWSRGAP